MLRPRQTSSRNRARACSLCFRSRQAVRAGDNGAQRRGLRIGRDRAEFNHDGRLWLIPRASARFGWTPGFPPLTNPATRCPGAQQLYDQASVVAATALLKRWYFWATQRRLAPIIDAARTIKRHQNGILRWFDTKIANGLIEAINSLVQAAKAKARGYRSLRNLVAIIYLIAGKIDLKLAT